MITETFLPEAVVLANGDFPCHPYALELLRNAPVVVCCDGAAETCAQHGYRFDAIVGDGDSLSPELKKAYAEQWYRIAEQETNDLSKAMRFLLVRGYRKVAILGATGKREDHTIGNISLLIDYMEQDFEVRMVTDYGIFIPARGTQPFQSHAGQQVSIFRFEAKNMTSEGLQYPLYDVTKWWQGTLNQSLGNAFTIRCSGSYLVYLTY